MPERPSFTCPRCGRTSYNPHDVIYGYCGACHDFTRVQIVDYLDIMPVGEKRSWPETREAMDRLKEIVRQSGAQIVPWQGHNIYRAVYGVDAPADHRFTLEEIAELCKRYVEMTRSKKEKP